MTKAIILVKICYIKNYCMSKLLQVIQEVKISLIIEFLASADIKVFGHTYVTTF